MESRDWRAAGPRELEGSNTPPVGTSRTASLAAAGASAPQIKVIEVGRWRGLSANGRTALNSGVDSQRHLLSSHDPVDRIR